MRPTTGSGVGPNSVEDAPAMPARSRAPSMQAICIPKQMPKYGMSRSRAKRTAAILPSAPRSPNAPGTRIAWHGSSRAAISPASPRSNSSASIQSTLTRTRLAIPPWTSASPSDLYASCRPTYLPTTPIVTSPSGLVSRSTMSAQRVRSGAGPGSIPNARSTSSSSPSAWYCSGTA